MGMFSKILSGEGNYEYLLSEHSLEEARNSFQWQDNNHTDPDVSSHINARILISNTFAMTYSWTHLLACKHVVHRHNMLLEKSEYDATCSDCCGFFAFLHSSFGSTCKSSS